MLEKIKHLWNSPSTGATLVMRSLESCLRGVTYLHAWRRGRKVEEVYDIADAGPNQRFLAINRLAHHNTLGLQYGMGKTKLARKLTIDCGREVTEKEAGKLIQLHRKVYRVYWKWAEDVTRTYRRDGFILLADGWGLNSHCDRETSVRNFPVQGTSAVILRRALVLAVESHVMVISPLHDAIYFCAPDEEFDEQMAALSRCMDQAVHEVLGEDVTIRQDKERHSHDHVWIEEGAEQVYHALAPYFQEVNSDTKKRIKLVKKLLTTSNNAL